VCGSSNISVAALCHITPCYELIIDDVSSQSSLIEYPSLQLQTFAQGHGSDSDFPVPVQKLSVKPSTSPKGGTAGESNGPKSNGHSHSDSSSSSHTAAAAAAVAAATASQRALLQYAMFLVRSYYEGFYCVKC
jgi:hypothetical protein